MWGEDFLGSTQLSGDGRDTEWVKYSCYVEDLRHGKCLSMKVTDRRSEARIQSPLVAHLTSLQLCPAR